MINNKKHYYGMVDWTLKQIDKIIKDKDRYQRNLGDGYKSWMRSEVRYEIDQLLDYIEEDLLNDYEQDIGDNN